MLHSNDIDTINSSGLVMLMEALHAQIFDRIENNRVNVSKLWFLTLPGMNIIKKPTFIEAKVNSGCL